MLGLRTSRRYPEDELQLVRRLVEQLQAEYNLAQVTPGADAMSLGKALATARQLEASISGRKEFLENMLADIQKIKETTDDVVAEAVSGQTEAR